MKILVADDERISRRIVETALCNLGHECVVVTDGAHAWEAFHADRPDVVISDWAMPGISGLQLCRDIRADATGDYTYFIMLTCHGAHDQIVEGMNAGVDDYLVKPLDPRDLQVRLIAAARVTALHGLLARQRSEMASMNCELSARSLRDPLTGLGNRRAIDEDLERLKARATRYGQRYCIALLDIDLFKSYNDAHGHLAGDEVLKAVAAQLDGKARTGDGVYRYGGEEFLCIFPEQTMESATIAIERMRGGVQGLAISHLANPHGVLTLSAGLAMLDAGCTKSVDVVLQEADEALYRAKDLGRNRIEYAGVQPG